MKVVFLSNFYNYHQEALSMSLCELVDEYLFVETTPMAEDRKKMGWKQGDQPPFVISHDAFLQEPAKVEREILDADIVIVGSAPVSLVKKRLKLGKLTFKYSERIFKAPKQYLTMPLRWIKYFCGRYRNMYLLSASAYARGDYRLTGCFKDRAYKWGYFPEVKRYEDISLILDEKKPASLLWVGRFIDWKHPEIPVMIAKRLKELGYRFELNMIGTGEMVPAIEKLIAEHDLSDCVHLLGAMKPEQVREYMEKTQIYLFTSDRNEGWGAVLNEAMNSACAVVASHAIGAVPFLIEDGQNGYIYRDGDEEDLLARVKMLLDDPDACKKAGMAAYLTMTETWNAEVAAERLIALSNTLLSGAEEARYEGGPCSKDR